MTNPCLRPEDGIMLEIRTMLAPWMLRFANSENRRHQCWCAVLVLFAVCLLTVGVATRYGFSRDEGSGGVTRIQKQLSPEPGRQRLIKNAATWIPPVGGSALLEAPSSYPRIAPAGPPIPSLFFEESLYNRPPPSSEFLS